MFNLNRQPKIPQERIDKVTAKPHYESLKDLLDETMSAGAVLPYKVDETLASLLLSYQEVRAYQESGNAAGVKDSNQLTKLENEIEVRAREIGFLK